MKKTQTGSRPFRRDRAWWSALLAGQTKSGLSVKAYCAAQGISAASYYRWQKQFKEDQGMLFSPIEVQTKALCGIEVALPGGILLRFNELPPVGYLRNLSLSFNGQGL